MAIDARLDVLVVRKLGAPMNQEFAIGAIGEGDVVIVHEEVLSRLGISPDELESIVNDARQGLEGFVRQLRGERQPVPVGGKTAILVDDGVATGSTAQVAARVVR